MAKITQEVHIYFKNGELTLYASFFYECSIVNLKKVIKMADMYITEPSKYIATLQTMVDILNTYYYFETITPAKKKQILNKRDLVIEKVEAML